MSTTNQVSTAEFLAGNPVFSLREANDALAPPRGMSGTVERLKHHLETGRLRRLARGLYAVVPPGQSPESFHPDPFLVARTLRPDGVFCHHSALELLGVAHSTWHQCTVFTGQRRPPLALKGARVLFLEHPRPFREAEDV
jgi:predicted transcriptional regulator of viral defense system